MKEDNKLIAEFMGLTIITDGISWFETNYKPLKKYHEDWNDLMPVIEKIMDVCFNDEGKATYDSDLFYSIRDCIPNISQTYKAAVQFIKEYNKNK